MTDSGLNVEPALTSIMTDFKKSSLLFPIEHNDKLVNFIFSLRDIKIQWFSHRSVFDVCQ